jgi:hypothetical protein
MMASVTTNVGVICATFSSFIVCIRSEYLDLTIENCVNNTGNLYYAILTRLYPE